MASSSKKKTTFAKMTRENKVRERRLIKQARKDERKRAAAAQPEGQTETPVGDELPTDPDQGVVADLEA
jgi:hypothetical protein